MEVKVKNFGTVKVPDGAKWADVLAFLDGVPKEKVVAVEAGGKFQDLSLPAVSDGEVSFVTYDTPEGLEILRHSTSHVMAEAVKSLFKGVKVTIGPAVEKGFYYDFDYPAGFHPEDLPRIEEKMREIIKADLPFVRKELKREEAIKFFEEQGESYKVELIKELPEGETISVYTQGSFTDLCRGPHIPRTGLIKAFKLTSIAGAYWRGDERNAMLQRIYGTVFPTEEELKKYLEWEEEARRRDHRRLGRELELFTIQDEVGAGMVIYHPYGMVIRNILLDFERREHRRRGYEEVMGPILLKKELWAKSGHLANYADKMYFTEVEGQEYGVKPMNCLAHMLIFKSKVRSWREMPKRYFEIGVVHRHEKSGELHGLTRVRSFTQDDAHILCMPEQLEEEISSILDFVLEVLNMFGFSYQMEISTRPEKFIGSAENYDKATNILINVLKNKGIPFKIDEGEGAFYGPKIDVKLKDALDRPWQCATIQCDFALPEAFDLTYVSPTNERLRPAMLHRVILGSVERFLAILTEHYAGAFPSWIAPVQAKILPVSDNFNEYAVKVLKQLKDMDVRVEADLRSEKLSYKIREAQGMKVPYMLVVGAKERDAGTVAVRRRDGKQLPPMTATDFKRLLDEENPTLKR